MREARRERGVGVGGDADLNVRDARGAAVLHYGAAAVVVVVAAAAALTRRRAAAFFGQRRITNLLLRKV